MCKGMAGRSRMLVLLLVLGISWAVRAGDPPVMPPHSLSTDTVTTAEKKEPERLVAGLLALTLGPFGAHRLYLGTVPKVPVIYGITFGGFGVLALLDLGHILFTKDLAPYRHNDRVFMWGRNPGAPTPP